MRVADSTGAVRAPAMTFKSPGSGGTFDALLQRSAEPLQAPELPPPAGNATDASAKLREAMTAFEKEAKMTPAERARRDVLADMNLTEEAINAMSPAQREAVEVKIAAAVKRRLDQPATPLRRFAI